MIGRLDIRSVRCKRNLKNEIYPGDDTRRKQWSFVDNTNILKIKMYATKTRTIFQRQLIPKKLKRY